jgi:hypothetical protein
MATASQFAPRFCGQPVSDNRYPVYPLNLEDVFSGPLPFFPQKASAMSFHVNALKFRQSADGEPNNLHSAQPELLLQLLQILQIAFQKPNGGGFEAGFQFVGQQPYSNSIRCFDKATGLPNATACISPVDNFSNFSLFNELDSYDARTLLLELLLVLVSEDRHTFAILDYLASAELAEEDVWLRDDIRIAWITVLYASQGRPNPWLWAFNRVVGGHPDKVIPQLVARRQKHEEMGLPPTPPKKPASPVIANTKAKGAAV